MARFYKHPRTRKWFFDSTIIILTRHFCYHIVQWEQWTLYGSSLNKTLLVNRKFPDKHFKASFEKVLITTEGVLNAFLKNLSEKHTEKMEKAWRTSQDEVPAEDVVQEHHRGDHCDMQNSSQLLSIINQVVTTMIQDFESTRNLQVLEYEKMLKSAYKKAQDLEVKVVQIEESNAVRRKKEDEKLVFLLRELDNARLVAEGSVANQSKLKLVEEDYKRVTNELKEFKSLLQSMELREKMARDEVEKLNLQCNRMHAEVNELKTLLHNAEANLQAKEEELLLKTKAFEEEVKTMKNKEENQKEMLKMAEKKLEIAMKRAADLESELKEASRQRKEDFVCLGAPVPAFHGSFRRSMENRKSFATKNDQSEVLNNAHGNDAKGLVHIEAKINSAECTIDHQETQTKDSEENNSCSRMEITELANKLRKSESEVSSHKELLSHVHKEFLEVKIRRDCLMEKLKKVERKAEADMLRIKVSLEESMFSQKCDELVAAVVVLLNKVTRLESFFQGMQSKIKLNFDASTIVISALNIELSCSKELINDLQDSLKKAEIENDTVRSEIKSITARFSNLNDQLKHETTCLEMQIALLMQENEDLNAMILRLQHQSQELSYVAKSQDKKLKEGQSRRRELEKEVHDLKVHLKEMSVRESKQCEKAQEATHHGLQDTDHHGSMTCTHFCFATFFAISLIGFWWISWQGY